MGHYLLKKKSGFIDVLLYSILKKFWFWVTVDKEELRADKAVKVTRKELNELIAELFEYTDIYNSNLKENQISLELQNEPEYTVLEEEAAALEVQYQYQFNSYNFNIITAITTCRRTSAKWIPWASDKCWSKASVRSANAPTCAATYTAFLVDIWSSWIPRCISHVQRVLGMNGFAKL